jgi:hypothetical protein
MADDKNKQTEGNEPKKADEEPEVKFDRKWLNGLKFSTTRIEKVKGEDGKVEKKIMPVIRPLKEDDLLDWKVRGNQVVLVAADGQKHRVEK